MAQDVVDISSDQRFSAPDNRPGETVLSCIAVKFADLLRGQFILTRFSPQAYFTLAVAGCCNEMRKYKWSGADESRP